MANWLDKGCLTSKPPFPATFPLSPQWHRCHFSLVAGLCISDDDEYEDDEEEDDEDDTENGAPDSDHDELWPHFRKNLLNKN